MDHAPERPADSSSGPAERHPEGESWRADALGRSRHSRLDQEVRPPDGDADPERAAAFCAELCRDLLGDFAPALLLLDPAERSRVQALVAYTHTLFDFARQRGVEGERLAQINRWEWSLELALSGGEGEGQPVFVAVAREHARRAWPEGALAALAASARRRATRERPATAGEAEAAAERLAGAFATALLGAPPPPEVAAFAGALVRLHGLQHLGPEAAANRCPLPLSELAAESLDYLAGASTAELLGGRTAAARAELAAAARRECVRLRPRLLKAPRGLLELPPAYRRAAVYSLLAALRLLTLIEDGDEGLLARPPRLGLLSRLGLLARARWLPRTASRSRRSARRGPGRGRPPG